MEETRVITLEVNGGTRTAEVPVRRLLSDFLRHDLGLTGTHVGCEHGVCGCCTVLFDGEAIRSCLMLAVQTDGHSLITVEGLASEDGRLHPIQQAFLDAHGLQCGFCTPGFVMAAYAFLNETPNPTEDQIIEGLSGNLCRCTGYQNIVEAVRLAARNLMGPDPIDAGRRDRWQS